MPDLVLEIKNQREQTERNRRSERNKIDGQENRTCHKTVRKRKT